MGNFGNFIKDLFKNRLGIVLATLHLCFFASKFSSDIYVVPGSFDKIMLIQNAPAIILSFIPGGLIKFLFTDIPWSVQQRIGVTLAFIFIALQWLFIAWIAKVIARKLKAQ